MSQKNDILFTYTSSFFLQIIVKDLSCAKESKCYGNTRMLFNEASPQYRVYIMLVGWRFLR